MEEIFNNGKNTILIDKDHCYLRVHGKKKVNTWMLDRDMRAVEQIKKHISKYGNFIANGDGKNGKLKEVVYRSYRPYGYKDGKVYLCNGNQFDLTSANLYVTGDYVPANQQRLIWHDEHRIWIKLRARDEVFFTEYDERLFFILCNSQLCSWYVLEKRNTKRLYCRGKYNGAPIGFSEIVWLYHARKIDTNNLIPSIFNGKRWLSETGLQIDHLRDNQQNNCPHSLAAMTAAQNTAKRNHVGKINLPYVFVPVRTGGSFRIICGQVAGDDPQIKYISCRDVESFLDCLAHFRSIAENSGKMLKTPLDATKTNCISRMLMDDGKEDHEGHYNVIEGLLQLQENEFEQWPFELEPVLCGENSEDRSLPT